MYNRQQQKPSRKKRKCKKAKWLSNEALQIAEKRRETKCKGDRESNRKLNAQCKEIEAINRKGKTRDLFKKMEILKQHFVQRWT